MQKHMAVINAAAKEKDFDSGDAKFKVRARDSIGVCNPINMLGNAGL
jgi:hypothetical protein